MKTTVYDFELDYAINDNNVSIDNLYGNKSLILVPDIIQNKYVKTLNKITPVDPCEKELIKFPIKNIFTVKEVHLPQTLVEIGEKAFCYCSNLKEIILPESIEALGRGCFKDLKHLTTVTFRNSNSLKAISESCFYGCNRLSKIHLPKNIERIEDKSFFGIKKIDIFVGKKISFISKDAFENLPQTKITIHFPEGFNYDFLNIPDFIYCENDNITYDDDRNFIASIKDNQAIITGTVGFMSYFDFPDFLTFEGHKYKVSKIKIKLFNNKYDYFYPVRRINLSNIKYVDINFEKNPSYCCPIVVDHDLDFLRFGYGCSYRFLLYTMKEAKILDNECNRYFIINETGSFDFLANYESLYNRINNAKDIDSLDLSIPCYSEMSIVGRLENTIYIDNFLYLILDDNNCCILKYDNTFKPDDIIIPSAIMYRGKQIPVTFCMDGSFDVYENQNLVFGKNIKLIQSGVFNGHLKSIFFEEDSIINFIYSLRIAKEQIHLPSNLKVIEQSIGDSFVFSKNTSIKFILPGNLNNFKGSLLPKSLIYFANGWTNDVVSDIDFEDESNINYFSYSRFKYKYRFKNVTYFEGCLYAGPRTNPYMLLIDVKDTYLPCYKIHKDCKCILDNAFTNAANLCSIELNEGLVSFLPKFGDYNKPSIKKWPSSLKYIGKISDSFAKGRSSPLPKNVLETNIFAPNEHKEIFLKPIIGNLISMYYGASPRDVENIVGYKILAKQFVAGVHYQSNRFKDLSAEHHTISDVACEFKMEQISLDDFIPVTKFTYKYDGEECVIYMDRNNKCIWFKKNEMIFEVYKSLPDYLIYGLDYIVKCFKTNDD